MKEQSLAESRPLGGSNFGQSDHVTDETKHPSTISVTYFHNVLGDMLLEEFKDL